jgi:Prophage minor tail protein Z (GPZ)
VITVSVESDIQRAIRELNLLPKEAERAAYRSMNRIADEIAVVSGREIARQTGISLGNRREAKKGGSKGTVFGRMYIQGASASRLMAVVGALPSAKNVGYYPGANPTPGKPGVTLKAWRTRTLYDRTFVKGKQGSIGKITRKVWRRTGKGKDDITDVVWGPSVRQTFRQPFIQARASALLKLRWPAHFERYLRAELIRLRGVESLRGVQNVLPGIEGPTITDEG